MYTKSQIKAIRANNIRQLAELGDGDIERAKTLYNRLVRYSKRRYRWGEWACNGVPTWMLDEHEREGERLNKLHEKLCKELEGYELTMTLPGLYPWVDGARIIELVWY